MVDFDGEQGSVTFLNHSSFLVDSGETKILCDPWYRGAAFGNSWRLLAENSHQIAELDYDYIFLSHEHPDHFSIPTLNDLPEGKTFIYQKTVDGKVANYLRAKGHKVIEFSHGVKQTVGDIDVTIYVVDGYDSTVLFRLPSGNRVLNINDCRIELDSKLLRQIKEDTGPNVELALVQFSYANWAGNVGDSNIAELLHKQTLERNKLVLDEFDPKYHLLFASYVYFSHKENHYWNDHFWLPQMESSLSSHGDSKIIVPIIDENFRLDSMNVRSRNNQDAIEFWEKKHADVTIVDDQTVTYSEDELRQSFTEFYSNVWTDNELSYAQKTLGSIPLSILVSDLGIVIELDLIDKGFSIHPASNQFDVVLCSEMIDFLFKNKFARGTVTINGRIQFSYETAFRFFVFFFIPYANNIGKFFSKTGLGSKDIHSINDTSVLSSIHSVDPRGIKALDNYLISK